MRCRVLAVTCLGVCLAWSALPGAQGASTATSAIPIRRVVLYKAGVGYFEHLARVVGSGELTMQFTSRQLDDVLNSLTAIDLDNGRVSGITYDSTAPIEQRLGMLGIQLPQGADRAEFYSALRGTHVVIGRAGGEFAGRLLGVERRQRNDGPIDELTIVGDTGRIQTFEINSALTVRIADAALRDDVAQYLSLVASSRTQELRHVTIAATGAGARRLLVSYVSEVPVWKSTYRLVFTPEDAQPLLQGWAIVDNTMGEDWTNVDLSLVAGAPQSFIQNISQPYYTARPVVPIPRTALLQPQTHEPALTSRADSVAVSGASPVGEVRTGQGFGLGAGRGPAVAGGLAGGMVGGLAAAPPAPQPPPPPQAAPGRSPAFEAVQTAAGQALADLFEYHVQQPITIRRNQSALVPILNAPIEAERVALWRPNLPDNRPLRALWITNTTASTLDGGSFSVMDGGAFAGEGLIEPLKPAERRLVCYGTDLGVLVSAKNDPASGRISRITAHDGVIVATEEDRSVWTYTLKNADEAARSLMIEHPMKAGWTVDANPAAVETTANLTRFKLVLEHRQDSTFTVREHRTLQTRVSVGDLDEARLVSFVQRGALEADLRRAIQPVADKRVEVVEADARVSTIIAKISDATSDEQRLRENLKALGTSKEDRDLHKRYAASLQKDEDALTAFQADLDHARAEATSKRAEFSRLVASLSFDIAS